MLGLAQLSRPAARDVRRDKELSGRRTGGERRLAQAAPGAPALYCQLERRELWTRRTRASSPSESSEPLTLLLHAAFIPKGKRSDCRNHRTALPLRRFRRPLRRPKRSDSHGLVAGPLALSLWRPQESAPLPKMCQELSFRKYRHLKKPAMRGFVGRGAEI